MKIIKVYSPVVLAIINALLCSMNTFADDYIVDKRKPFIVYMIHGLSGNMDTFGNLEEVIKQNYDNYQYSNPEAYRLKFEQLVYNTNPKTGETIPIRKAQVFDFVQAISAEIISYVFEQKEAEGLDESGHRRVVNINHHSFVYEQPVDENTPYLFIVHSQGGLIAMSYANTCIDPEHYNKCSYVNGYKQIGKLLPKEGRNFNRVDPSTRKDQNVMNLITQVMKDARKKIDWSKKVGQSPKNLKQIITLNSPIWGTGTAAKAVHSPLLRKALESDRFPLPTAQLIGLGYSSLSSAYIRAFFQNRYKNQTPLGAMSVSEEEWSPQHRWVSPFNSTIDIVNVAGLIGDELDEGLFSLQGFYKNGIETVVKPEKYFLDVIVGAPEARLDYIYYIENENPNKQLSNHLQGVTQATNEYYPIKVAHVPIAGLPGVAHLSMNKQDEGYYKKHPTWPILQKALNRTFFIGQNDQEDQKISAQQNNLLDSSIDELMVDEINGYSVDIKFVTPKGYHRQFRTDLNSNIKPIDVQKFERNKATISGTKLNMTSGYSWDAINFTDNFYQSYFHVGRVREGFGFQPKGRDRNRRLNYEETYRLNYHFDVLGFEPIEFTHGIYPSYNSYAEVRLKPYHPIKFNNIESENKAIALIIVKHDSQTMGNNKYRVFSMRMNQLEVTEKIFSQLTSQEKELLTSSSDGQCLLGLTGQTTPRQIRYFDSNQKNHDGSIGSWKLHVVESVNKSDDPLWVTLAKNQNQLFNDFLDPIYTLTFNGKTNEVNQTSKLKLIHAEPLEILGRASLGFKDPYYDVGRECTQTEKESEIIKHTKFKCDQIQRDRYLVTSSKIRKIDKVKKIQDVTIENDILKGARWINVVDVDVVKALNIQSVTNSKGHSQGVMHPSEHTTTCLGNNKAKQYLSVESYQKKYYWEKTEMSIVDEGVSSP